METALQKFRDWEPSGLDSKEENYIDWGESKNYYDWLVGPCKTRDAQLTEQSNFSYILNNLGGENENVEILGFGHWACGHYDLILVRPDTQQAKELAEIAEQLKEYPIFNEDDYYTLEFETTKDYINTYLPEDLMTDVAMPEIAAEVYDWIWENDPDQLENHNDCGGTPDPGLIDKALKALGYYSKSQVEQDHQEKLLAGIYPDDCICESCRNRRLEAQNN